MRNKLQWRRASGMAVGFAFALCLNAVAQEGEFELSASQPTVVMEAGGPSEMAAKEMAAKKANASRSGAGVYIIQLEDPSIATYTGGIPGYQATSLRVTGGQRLDTNSKPAKKYENRLKAAQKSFIADCESSFGHTIDVKFKYQHVLNGMAMELSAEEAAIIAKMPGVKSVELERMEVPLTDVGPQWINAPAIWNPKSRKSPGSKGEGMVIGVLDSGINFDHPSFADIGGDGYDHTNPLGSGNYIPGSYCDANPSFCNDKLIGAWGFVAGPADPGSPEASDGHGVHTASTAGGNVVNGATIMAPTTMFIRDVSGVAPHANIIAYDVCIDSCPGSALVAAVNQVVIDSGNLPNGIAAINYSISGGSNPYNDAVELGFLAAADAGIYVSASAGNSGPGAGTVAHVSPWVGTTAASTHNRVIENSVIDLDSSGGALPDIVGAGLTSGYGPETIIDSASLESTFPGSTLCGLGSLGDFNPPWPPGTFSGEIVACTRGTFGRVEKGANALAAGAGGYILMDNGGGVVGDAHVLPGVHISQADGDALRSWLAANAGSTTGSIEGFTLNLDDANGDVMAGFSSRGPSGAFDVLKPDVTAPGVSIMAAEDTDGVTFSPEFGFLSGTSMSSPHHAGSAALIKAVQPDWSPHQIKSALMMTASTRNTVKEDGATPTDHFDLGAGRIDLSHAANAGLVLDETTANFLAADPGLGGDPKTLNIASMQNGNCVEECSWTRTVENVSGKKAQWRLSADAPAGLEITTDPKKKLKLDDGENQAITVTANTALATPGWNFATLELDRKGNKGPDLHMPIAVFASGSSNANVLNKTVDAATAAKGEPLNYQIDITNGQLAGMINLSDVLPSELDFVPGSETEVVTNGTTSSPFSYSGGTLSWSGELDQSGFGLAEVPFGGYFSLASIGVSPFPLPSNCDDGAWIIGGVPFVYRGESYNDVIWSVNGTLEAGTASGLATSFANQDLPDPTVPNNLMAPWWTDLNLCAGGNWYVAGLTDGTNFFTVFEWEDVPRWSDPSTPPSTEIATFQIWIVDGTDLIWFVYDSVQGVDGTVGVENSDGTVGEARYYDGAGIYPDSGTDLLIEESIGGTATFTFQAEVGKCKKGEAIINRVNVTTADAAETAIAATKCVKDDDDSSDDDSDDRSDDVYDH